MESVLPVEHPFYNPYHDINNELCTNTPDLPHESPLFIKRNGNIYKRQLSKCIEYSLDRKKIYMRKYRQRQKMKQQQQNI